VPRRLERRRTSRLPKTREEDDNNDEEEEERKEEEVDGKENSCLPTQLGALPWSLFDVTLSYRAAEVRVVRCAT